MGPDSSPHARPGSTEVGARVGGLQQWLSVRVPSGGTGATGASQPFSPHHPLTLCCVVLGMGSGKAQVSKEGLGADLWFSLGKQWGCDGMG